MMNPQIRKKIVLFGSSGFIGSHLLKYLNKYYIVLPLKINSSESEIEKAILDCDIIIHAAGVTRSDDESDFFDINIKCSSILFQVLSGYSQKKIIYFSSIHYFRNDIYGFSKRYNEFLIHEVSSKNCCYAIRTPGVFGPGSRPNGVSVVSTFCYNEINGINSTIVDPLKELKLIYIDDLINSISILVDKSCTLPCFEIIEPEAHEISVERLFLVIKEVSKINVNEFSKIALDAFRRNIFLTLQSYK